MRQADEEGNFPDWDDDSYSTILKLKSNEMWIQDETEVDTDGDGTTDKTIVSETQLK